MNWGGQWKYVVALVAINFAFGLVNLLLKKALDKGLNHLTIVTYRQAISATFLAPIAYFRERKSRSELTVGVLCQLFFSALIGITLSQYSFLLGLESTSATFLSAFINMVPVNTFILALPFGLEKVNIKSKRGRAKAMGALLCVCGALLLTLYRGMPLANSHSPGAAPSTSQNKMIMKNSSHRTNRWAVGSVFLGAGSLLLSSWFLVQARIGKKYPYQYSSTAILSIFSTIQSGTLSLIIQRNISMWALKGASVIFAVTYAGIMGSGLCYVGMSWCVKHKGPVYTAAFTPVNQIFVAMLDFSILHERIYLGSVLGSILLITGMYILLWGKNKEAQAAEEESEDCNKPASQAIPVTINSR